MPMLLRWSGARGDPTLPVMRLRQHTTAHGVQLPAASLARCGPAQLLTWCGVPGWPLTPSKCCIRAKAAEAGQNAPPPGRTLVRHRRGWGMPRAAQMPPRSVQKSSAQRARRQHRTRPRT